MEQMKQQAAIIRGAPGSGKSTAANLLKESMGFVVVETDQFLMENGVYQFDGGKLPDAHDACLAAFKAALARGESVAVANTFIQVWQMVPYLEACFESEVPVEVIECRGRFENVHGVTEDRVQKMRRELEPFSPSTILHG